jgi:hypothetical protein
VTFAARPILAVVIALVAASAQAEPTLPDFNAATFVPGAPITNPHFPLLDDLTRIYTATDAEGNPVDERFELTRAGAGPIILGVATTQRRDRSFEEGLLVEDTFDFYAQDTAGNVWYLGEDVTNYVYDEDGNLISTNNSSAWRAGVNGALPGFAMPATQTLGQSYYQEFAPADDALDQAETSAIGLTVIAGGRTFTDVLRVYETSAIDPDARGFKYYAPGVGLILEEEGLDANRLNPELTLALVAAVPEPSSALLLLLGLPLIAGWRRKAT